MFEPRPAALPPRPLSMSWASIALYVGLALAVSWALQLFAVQAWGLASEQTARMFMVVMWSPTLVALGFIAFNRAARSGLLWKPGRLQYLPLSVLVPTLIGFATLAILMVAGAATSGWFHFTANGVAISGGPWVLGEGFQNWPVYVANVAVTAVIFSVITLGVTVGEEFAWRGFLQGHLTRRAGVIRGILILSFIWWIWHLPALLAGYNFPNYPVLGALVLFPLQMIGLSFFFGWLTIRSGSFWPAALGHAALNTIQQGVIDNLQLSVGIIYVDILRTALGLIVGLMCWASLGRDPE